MLTRATRRTALAAGIWESHDGQLTPIRALVDDHLVNALLCALEEGRPLAETTPLAAEVQRRGLTAYALTLAAERDARRHR